MAENTGRPKSHAQRIEARLDAMRANRDELPADMHALLKTIDYTRARQKPAATNAPQTQPTHEERITNSRQAAQELQTRVEQRRAQEASTNQRQPTSNSQRASSQPNQQTTRTREEQTGMSFEDEFPDVPTTTPIGNAKYVLLGIDGIHMGKTFPVTKQGVTIGVTNTNDIVMPHGIGVNPKHAVIKPGLRNVQINLTKNSTVHVDGEEHSMNFLKRGLAKAKLGTVKLPLGSGIAFGPNGTEHEMLLLPASKDASLSPNNWSLFAIDGPHKGTKFNLKMGDNIIGTRDNSDVKLSKGAKPEHAKITIERDEDGEIVLNLNKLQGKVKSTQIIEDEIYHDEPVEKEEQINSGYKIQIDKHKFVLLPPSNETTTTTTAQTTSTQSTQQTNQQNTSLPRTGSKLKRIAKATLLAGALAGLGYGGYKAYQHFETHEENKPKPVAVKQLSLEDHLRQEVESLKAEGVLPENAKVHMELDGEKLIGDSKVLEESKKKVSNGLLEQSRTSEVTYDIPNQLAFAQGDVLSEYGQHNVALDLVTKALGQQPQLRRMHITIQNDAGQLTSDEASKRLIARALQHI